jgi:hypothetical protein
MPKWWPWGRREETVAPPAPAARPEPVWQRLAAITPTTGDIQPTAHLNGFAATLTTSQNPGFTRPVQLLAVDEGHRLPVLDTGPARPDPIPPTTAPTPATESRSWMPRLPSVQRAHVGTPVQRISAQDEPVAAALPVIDTGGEPEAPRAMVQADDPDERRPLDVVATEDGPDEPPAPSASTAGPLTAGLTAVEHPTPPAPAIQRLATDAPTLPTVVQRLSSSPLHPDTPSTAATETFHAPHVSVPDGYPAGHTEIAAPPLRHLHTVQRIDSVAPTVPLLPVVAAGPPRPAARPEHEASIPEPATAVQRIPDTGDPVPVAVDDGDQPAPAVELAAVGTPHAEPSMTAETTAAAAPSVTVQHPPHPPAAVQRLTPQPNPTTPTPPVHSAPHPAATPDATTKAVEITDLPVVSTELRTVTLDEPPVTEDREAPTVQRSSAVVFTEPETRREPPAHVHSVSVSAESRPQPATVMRTVDDSPYAAPARSPIGSHHVARPPEPAVAQRVSLPVVVNPPPPPAAPQAPRPASSEPPVVQRSTGSARRLVVLPPVRSAGDHGSTPSAVTPPDGAAMVSSPRPVGLQRMFDAGSQRGRQPLAAPAAYTPTPQAPAHEHWSHTDTAQFTTSSHDDDAGTNTITFASPSMPSVQRAAEEPAPAAEPAAAVTAAPALASAPTVSGAGAPGAAGTDVDELVNRVYDALAARLRTELWLDRERAGTLMDLGR